MLCDEHKIKHINETIETHRVKLLPLPDENNYFYLLKKSKLVIAKDGYQQTIESLTFGTPVLCKHVPGGTPFFPDCLKESILLADEHDKNIILNFVEDTLLQKKKMNWSTGLYNIKNPLNNTAVCFETIIRLL
jgi:hypothetical protein